MKTLCLLAGLWSFSAASAQTLYEALPAADPIRQDVYVKLYASRVESREEQAAIAKAKQDEAATSYTNVLYLRSRGAASDEDVDGAEALRDRTALQTEIDRALVEESQILLDIAVTQVATGSPMPICAESR